MTVCWGYDASWRLELLGGWMQLKCLVVLDLLALVVRQSIPEVLRLAVESGIS